MRGPDSVDSRSCQSRLRNNLTILFLYFCIWERIWFTERVPTYKLIALLLSSPNLGDQHNQRNKHLDCFQKAFMLCRWPISRWTLWFRRRILRSMPKKPKLHFQVFVLQSDALDERVPRCIEPSISSLTIRFAVCRVARVDEKRKRNNLRAGTLFMLWYFKKLAVVRFLVKRRTNSRSTNCRKESSVACCLSRFLEYHPGD